MTNRVAGKAERCCLKSADTTFLSLLAERQRFKYFLRIRSTWYYLTTICPEMNGDVVAERMKSAQPDIPIVMLSGDEDLSDTSLQSVDGFVSKNESPQCLIEVVEYALELHHLFRPLSELRRTSVRQRVA
jgi:DNA-binding NarL/FixJ family response regulator